MSNEWPRAFGVYGVLLKEFKLQGNREHGNRKPVDPSPSGSWKLAWCLSCCAAAPAPKRLEQDLKEVGAQIPRSCFSILFAVVFISQVELRGDYMSNEWPRRLEIVS